MNHTDTLIPFRIDIPEADVVELRDRLAHTRWPVPVPGRDDPADFSRGIPLPYLAELAEHWRDGYDWRTREAELNALTQFTTVIDGQTFHVVHVRSENPDAVPLLLNHGWPGSFVEYQLLIPLLTSDFHVVIATPPGFGFSTPLSSTGWDLARTTDAFAEIMTRLGYARFAVHGTDIGSGIAGNLAAAHPDRVIGVHLGVDRAVLGLVGVVFPRPEGLSDDETAQLAAVQAASAAERGYLEMHNHRPDTIAASLADSPVGLLAWIAEKFKTRTDDGHRPPVVDRDQLLTVISVYWFTRSGASSIQFYYESEHTTRGFTMAFEVPTAWAAFDSHPLIRRAMDPANAIGHWSDFTEGGHFPAMEEPELLAEDLRGFVTSI
jgi:pimeloyl-ACP methyl ester carboxylesterase